jgi:hypothetical protein
MRVRFSVSWAPTRTDDRGYLARKGNSTHTMINQAFLSPCDPNVSHVLCYPLFPRYSRTAGDLLHVVIVEDWPSSDSTQTHSFARALPIITALVSIGTHYFQMRWGALVAPDEAIFTDFNEGRPLGDPEVQSFIRLRVIKQAARL